MAPRVRHTAREDTRRGALPVALVAQVAEREIPLPATWAQPASDKEGSLDSGHGGPLPFRFRLLALGDLAHSRGESLRDAVIIRAGLLRDVILILPEAVSLPGVPPLLRGGPWDDVVIRAPVTGRPIPTAPGAHMQAANRLVKAVVCLRRVDAFTKVANPRAPSIELPPAEHDGLTRRICCLLGASGRGRTSELHARGTCLCPRARGWPRRGVLRLQGPGRLVTPCLLRRCCLRRRNRRALRCEPRSRSLRTCSCSSGSSRVSTPIGPRRPPP